MRWTACLAERLRAGTQTHNGGDRFGAVLAAGLARGWPREVALALGNACSSHLVERGENGDADALGAALDRTGEPVA